MSTPCGPNAEYKILIGWFGGGQQTRPGISLTSNRYFDDGITGWSPENSTIEVVSDLGFPTLKVTPSGVDAAGSGGATIPGSAPGTITPGDDYLTEMWVYSPGGWDDLRASLSWYTAGGSFISSGLGVPTSVPAGVWTRTSQTFTAPATASRARFRARYGGSPAASDIYYVWGGTLADPSVTGVYDYPDPLGDVTSDVLGEGSWSSSYGRDQARQLSPAAAGTAGWTLCNVGRVYSPENAASPLFNNLGPGRRTEFRVDLDGTDYALFTGRIDDFNVKADFGDRNGTFTGLDGLGDLRVINLSTAVYFGLRTGQIVNIILDEAGWDPGLRDIDVGATFPRYWWAEGKDALTALLEMVQAEGPPSVVYVAPDGTLVFKDRHHRLQDAVSRVSQATFASGALGVCQ